VRPCAITDRSSAVFAYDSTANVLVERWSDDCFENYDSPFISCEVLHQTDGGAWFLLRFCDTGDPEDKVIVPVDYHQALAWAEENCGAAELERVVGQQPEASDEAG
jgi:hypothetical protein